MLKVANSVINASQITGVLPVVNGGTGVTTSTGTGNTVLSAAPTLSGNVTLSTGNLILGTSGKGIDFSAAGGDVFTQIGGSITLAGGATGTLFTPGSSEAYLVTVAPSSGDSNSSGACLVISRFGTSLPVLATIGASSLVFTASGGALQITNGTAFSYDYDWTAVKLIH